MVADRGDQPEVSFYSGTELAVEIGRRKFLAFLAKNSLNAVDIQTPNLRYCPIQDRNTSFLTHAMSLSDRGKNGGLTVSPLSIG
jgi:hypothetical protein